MAKIIDPDDLTYSVNGSTGNLRFDTTAKTIRLVEGGSFSFFDGVTGQCLYSKIKEVLKADPDLIRLAPVPVREMIHDESLEIINGWTFYDASTLKAIRDCGVALVAANGNPTKMYACFTSLGTLAAGTTATDIYYTLSSATNATTQGFTHVHTGESFGVNELVEIYSDTNADGTPDADNRSYAKLFLRRAGYTYDEADNTEIGYPTLTYKKYNFPLSHAVDQNIVADDATIASWTGMALQWYATAQSKMLGTNGPYNFHVIANGGGHTHKEVYSWFQWKLRQSSDIDDGSGNRTGKVTPMLAYMDGDTLKTKYQAGIGGVHVDNLSASSLNNIAEADDTNTYRTYPYVAAITFEFDDYLQADGSDAKFWIFDAATYPGAGATLLQDAGGNPMTGTVTGPSVSFSYAWSANKPWVGIAVGKTNAKVAVASGTIEQSTGNKGVFVSGIERWYRNP